MKIQEVASVAGVSWSQVAGIVDAFRRPGNSFLVPPAGVALEEDSVVDITHESLIRLWGRLREWVRDEALRAERYRKLEGDAREWRDRQKSHDWLLRSPALDEALAWRAVARPSGEWAKRYGGAFDLVTEFLTRSVRRDRLMRARKLGASIVVFLFLCLSASLFVWSLETANRQAIQLAVEQQEARVEQQAISLAYELAALSQQARTLALGHLDISTLLALESIERHPTLQGDHALRESLRLLPPRPQLWSAAGGATALAFAPGGGPLLAVSKTAIRSFDIAAQRERRLESQPTIEAWRVVAVDPTGRYLALREPGAALAIVEVETGKQVGRTVPDPGVFAFQSAMGERGTLAFYTGASVQIVGLNAKRGAARVRLQDHEVAALSRDARFAATWAAASEVVRVTALDGTWRDFSFKVGASPIVRIDFSPDGNFVAAASRDGLIRAWSVARGEEVGRVALTGDTMAVRDIALGWHADFVAVTSPVATQVFDLRDRNQASEMIRLERFGIPSAMSFSADGHYFAASTPSGTGVWALRAGGEVMRAVLDRSAAAIAISPDKSLLATATIGSPAVGATSGHGSAVALWGVATGDKLFERELDRAVTDLHFSSGGAGLLVATADGEVRRLNIAVAPDGQNSVHGAGPAGDDGTAWRVDSVDLGCGADARFAALSDDGAHVALRADGRVCSRRYSGIARSSWCGRLRDCVALSSDGAIAAFAGSPIGRCGAWHVPALPAGSAPDRSLGRRDAEPAPCRSDAG